MGYRVHCQYQVDKSVPPRNCPAGQRACDVIVCAKSSCLRPEQVSAGLRIFRLQSSCIVGNRPACCRSRANWRAASKVLLRRIVDSVSATLTFASHGKANIVLWMQVVVVFLKPTDLIRPSSSAVFPASLRNSFASSFSSSHTSRAQHPHYFIPRERYLDPCSTSSSG